MSAFARGTGDSGASNIVSGTISINSTWYEDVELTQDGEPLTGVDGFDWVFTFRKSRGCSPELTLSTSESTITILEDTDVTLMQIRVAPSRLSSMCGDYFADIKATDSGTTVDGSPRVIHYAHGIVTFVGDPSES